MSQISLPIGNINLLQEKSKTAFLSSRRAPKSCLPNIEKWIDSLSPETDCVIMGHLQELEDYVFQKLLKRSIPIVLVYSSPYPEMWPTNMVNAIGDGLLLIVTTSEFDTPFDTKKGRAEFRNKYIISNADKIVVGVCRPGGNLEQQLIGFTNVEYLNEYVDSPDWQ